MNKLEHYTVLVRVLRGCPNLAAKLMTSRKTPVTGRGKYSDKSLDKVAVVIFSATVFFLNTVETMPIAHAPRINSTLIGDEQMTVNTTLVLPSTDALAIQTLADGGVNGYAMGINPIALRITLESIIKIKLGFR